MESINSYSSTLFTEAAEVLRVVKHLSPEDALTEFLSSVKSIGWDETQRKITDMKKEKYLALHQKKYQIYQGSDGYWRTDFREGSEPRRTVRRKSREELENYIVEYYYAKESEYSPNKMTLEKLFPLWVKDCLVRKKVEKKTIYEYQETWNRFYADTTLVSMSLNKLSVPVFYRFFEDLTFGRQYTRKCIGNAKDIISMMLDFAVRKEILQHNTLKDVAFKSFNYKPTKPKTDDVYSIEDAHTLLSHLETIREDLYALAIRMDFNLFIRIGELKALSWEDVNLDKREIYVHKQLVESREISDDLSFGPREVHEKDRMKGNTQSGYRHEYLTDEAIEILREARMLNPNGKYIFMPYGRVMNTNTFNDHLKKHCKECGIKYRSSHKIRFYTASVTYDGKNTRELSKQMGHSQVSTTIGYLRDVNQTEDLASLFSRLGKNAYKA